MGKKKKTATTGLKKKKQQEVPLYRVFRVADGQLAYLPVPGSKGLPLEEAQRLSSKLAVETEVRCVFEPEEEQ